MRVSLSLSLLGQSSERFVIFVDFYKEPVLVLFAHLSCFILFHLRLPCFFNNFFKDFIYLFDRDRDRQREKEHKHGAGERKKQAASGGT